MVHQPDRRAVRVVEVPKDYIVYPCKISGARFVKIPLPPTKFTKRDAERLFKLMLTQVDDMDMEDPKAKEPDKNETPERGAPAYDLDDDDIPF